MLVKQLRVTALKTKLFLSMSDAIKQRGEGGETVMLA
jgi:hypothetical protein